MYQEDFITLSAIFPPNCRHNTQKTVRFPCVVSAIWGKLSIKNHILFSSLNGNESIKSFGSGVSKRVGRVTRNKHIFLALQVMHIDSSSLKLLAFIYALLILLKWLKKNSYHQPGVMVYYRAASWFWRSWHNKTVFLKVTYNMTISIACSETKWHRFQ